MPSRKPAKRKSDVISLADEEPVKKVVSASPLSLWDVVNTLTRLRPSRREQYRVSIFGSARVARGSFAPSSFFINAVNGEYNSWVGRLNLTYSF